MPAIKRKRSHASIPDVKNAKDANDKGSSKLSAQGITYPPFNTLQDLVQALRTENEEILIQELTRFRFVFTPSRSDVPSQASEKFKVLLEYIEQISCQELFSIWDTAIQNRSISVQTALPPVFAMILQVLSFVPTQRTTGHALIRRLLTTESINKSIHRMLQSDRNQQTLNSIKLMHTITTFGEGIALLDVVNNFEIKPLPKLLSMRRTGADKDEGSIHKPDIRVYYIQYVLSFFLYGPTNVKKAILDTKDMLSAVFRGFHLDHASTIQFVINTIYERILCDSKLPKSSKTSLFGTTTLENIVKVYSRTDSEPLHERRDASTIVPADIAHHFLLLICCKPEFGVCFQDAGWYNPSAAASSITSGDTKHVKIFNKILSSFIALLQPTEDTRQMELLLRILRACPELVVVYWQSTPLTFEPRLSSRWLANFALLGKAIALPPPSLLLPGSEFLPRNPPLSSIVVESILPSIILKAYLTKGIKNPSPLVQLWTVVFLTRVLQKLQLVIEAFEKAATAADSAWSNVIREIQVEIKARFVDVQTIIALQQSLALENSESPSKKSPLLYETATRLLKLCLQILPGVSSELTFDVGKVIKEGVQDDNADGLQVLTQCHALELVLDSPGFKYTGKSSKSSNLSHVGELLMAFLSTPYVQARALLERLLFRILSTATFFDHNPREVYAWIVALPSESPRAVVEFLDDCILRISRSPYGYYDALTALSDGSMTDSSTVSFSPLLTTVMEQWKHYHRKGDIAEEAKLRVMQFIARFFLELAGWTGQLSVLVKAMDDLVQDAAEVDVSADWRKLMTNTSMVLAHHPTSSIDKMHVLKLHGMLGLEGLTAQKAHDAILLHGLFWPEIVQAVLAHVTEVPDKIQRLYNVIPFSLLLLTMTDDQVRQSQFQDMLQMSMKITIKDERTFEHVVRLLIQRLVKTINAQVRDEFVKLTFGAIHLAKDLHLDLRSVKERLIDSQLALQDSDLESQLIECKLNILNVWFNITDLHAEDRAFTQPHIARLRSLNHGGEYQYVELCAYEDLQEMLQQMLANSISHQSMALVITEISTRGQLAELPVDTLRKIFQYWLGSFPAWDLHFAEAICKVIKTSPMEFAAWMKTLSSENRERMATTLAENLPSKTAADIMMHCFPLDAAFVMEFFKKCNAESFLHQQALMDIANATAAIIVVLPFLGNLESYKFAEEIEQELKSLCTKLLEFVLDIVSEGTSAKDDSAFKIATFVVKNAQASLVTTHLTASFLKKKGAGLTTSAVRLVKYLLTRNDADIETIGAFARQYSEHCLKWMVRRFSEDLSSAEVLLDAIKEFGSLLPLLLASGGSKTLLFGVVEPVFTSALRNRLDQPVIMDFLAKLFETFEHSSELSEKLLQIMTAHEQLSVLISTSALLSVDVDRSKVRLYIIKLIWSILERTPSLAWQLTYMDALIPAYGGTMNIADQFLLDIFQRYEQISGTSISLRLSIWGSASTRLKLVDRVKSIQGGTFIGDMMECFNTSVMAKTITAFPHSRNVKGIDYDLDSDEIYDPAFVMSSVSSAVGHFQQGSDIRPLISSNALGVVVMCLSSMQEEVRRVARSLLAAFCRILKASTFKEQPQVLWLLQSLQNAAGDEAQDRIPSIIAIFVAQGLSIQMNSSNVLYYRLNNFLLARPTLDLKDIPLFYNLLNSDGDDYRRDQKMILHMIKSGLSTDSDYSLFRRRHVFDLILNLYQSGSADNATKRLVLETIYQAAKASPRVATDLLTHRGVLAWVAQQASAAKEEMIYVFPRLVLHLLRMADKQKVVKRLGDTWMTLVNVIISACCAKLIDASVEKVNIVHACLKLFHYAMRMLSWSTVSLAGKEMHVLADFAKQVQITLQDMVEGNYDNGHQARTIWDLNADVGRLYDDILRMGFELAFHETSGWICHLDFFTGRLDQDSEQGRFASGETIKANYVE